MRTLLFALLCLLFSPLMILGLIVFFIRVKYVSIPQGISGTANDPFGSRLALHMTGKRQDLACYKLGAHLPVYTRFVRFSTAQTMSWAVNVSGFNGGIFTYPIKKTSTLSSFINHRCEFIDRELQSALRQENPSIEQFVVLGAGFDTRCYDLPEDKHIKCFEVDMPSTLRAKVRGLKAAGIDCSHVTFVETDFNQETWGESLVANGFDADLSTFILWEGVTMYLNDAAILETLKTFANLPAGSLLVFDYFSRELVEQQPPFEKLGKVVQRSSSFYGESFHFGIETAEPKAAGARKLLESSGLQLVEHEEFGSFEKGKIPFGGLVLASRLSQSGLSFGELPDISIAPTSQNQISIMKSVN